MHWTATNRLKSYAFLSLREKGKDTISCPCQAALAQQNWRGTYRVLMWLMVVTGVIHCSGQIACLQLYLEKNESKTNDPICGDPSL